jgi:hypothetical protein
VVVAKGRLSFFSVTVSIGRKRSAWRLAADEISPGIQVAASYNPEMILNPMNGIQCIRVAY